MAALKWENIPVGLARRVRGEGAHSASADVHCDFGLRWRERLQGRVTESREKVIFFARDTRDETVVRYNRLGGERPEVAEWKALKNASCKRMKRGRGREVVMSRR